MTRLSKPTEEQINKLRPKPVNGLTSLDINGLVNYIKTNHAKNIIILQGAGISCAAGIPDFRTPGTGLYDNLEKFHLSQPEDIFSIDYFLENPAPFFELAKDMLPGKFKPTYAHYLPVILNKHNLLLRVYTQNIDGLERFSGLPPDKIVECHGTYFTAHCLKCNTKYEFKDIKGQMETGKVVKCQKCHEGVIKPDIVFYGEYLPGRFSELMENDFKKCDLLIVIGTSLKVGSVSYLPGMVNKNVPRVLINNEKVNTYNEVLALKIQDDGSEKLVSNCTSNQSKICFRFGHILNTRDIFIGGDCQKAVHELINKIGWEDEYSTIVPEETLQMI